MGMNLTITVMEMRLINLTHRQKAPHLIKIMYTRNRHHNPTTKQTVDDMIHRSRMMRDPEPPAAVHSSSAILEAAPSPFQNHPEPRLEEPTPGPAAVVVAAAIKTSLHIQGNDIIDGVYLVAHTRLLSRHTQTQHGA
jgi:hypothetical protein